MEIGPIILKTFLYGIPLLFLLVALPLHMRRARRAKRRAWWRPNIKEDKISKEE